MKASALKQPLGVMLAVLVLTGALGLACSAAALAVSSPTVASEVPSSVTQTSAVLNATVNPNGATVEECRFEYGTSTSYGFNLPCGSSPGSGNSPVAVSATLPGLSANMSYHYRIVAVGPGGTSYGGDEAFRTPPKAPTVVTAAASSVSGASATLNATVNPNGGEVGVCELEYGTSTAYGASVPCAALPGAGEAPVAVSAQLTGLSANTAYHFRIAASNPGGTGYGLDRTFTTLPEPPTAATESASAVGQRTATLNASVNPRGGPVESCSFEYGTSTFYGATQSCSALPGSGSEASPVSAAVAGLSAATSYHFRVTVTGPGGAVHGGDAVFQTLPDPPAVATGAASALTPGSATLNATVNPNGGTVTTCELEYGTTTAFGSSVPCSALPGSGSSAVAVAAAVQGLASSTTYYFRIVAGNSGGMSYGADQSLTTLPPVGSQGVLPNKESNTPPVPDVELLSRSLKVSRTGVLTFRATCPSGESTCIATLTIRSRKPVLAGAQANAAILELAKISFKISGGHAKTVRVRLFAKGRKLLARRRTLSARATIVAHDPAGARHTSRILVTLHAS